MDVNGVNWLVAIIVGGLAGWLAEKLMKGDMGLFMNIILGIVGAIVLNFILSLIGLDYTGWFAFLIIGVIGACLLIFVTRLIRGRT
jgi:uncharacterized membrane protein YeaQ/YmgE (transglycosylase-associated protein family)